MQLAECQGGTQVAGTSRDLREGWLPGSADWTHESCQRSSSPTCRGAGFPWRAGLGGSWPGIRHVSHGSQIPQGGHRHLSLTAEVTALSTGGGGKASLLQRVPVAHLLSPFYRETGPGMERPPGIRHAQESFCSASEFLSRSCSS